MDLKILIVDDNSDDRRYLKASLEAHGCKIAEARDGQEGLDLARSVRPVLIISDALMPNMDGFQLLRAVKTDAGCVIRVTCGHLPAAGLKDVSRAG